MIDSMLILLRSAPILRHRRSRTDDRRLRL